MKKLVRTLLADYASGEILSAELISQFFEHSSSSVLIGLLDAVDYAEEEKSSAILWGAMILVEKSGSPFELSSKISPLLLETWHECHEDIARALQKMKNPECIDNVFKATELDIPYLAHSECCAFEQKCVWVLAAIATQRALEKLDSLSKYSRHEIIKSLALQKLKILKNRSD